MPSVDNRVVAMKFDNTAFEQKIATTTKSLDSLKKSLEFHNASKGLSDVQTAANNFNLAGIASATEHIASKFDAMGAAATAVIFNLVNRALAAGESIAKAFTLAPMMDGFREYETTLNSIQTVLSNTKEQGTNLDDVNRALDQLNTYSDQTIYNFAQMARNIGTFTAAGIDLDTSVNAIKGIANLAAISGSNSEQASTAMYQLSQALASGTVKLMDWNSVVNAGMGGAVFQKALFETGKALKTIKDVPMAMTFEQWKDAGNSFRGSLEQGWITADVLTNTLSGFTGDLTEAQVMSMGYTKEQTAAILEMGKTGKDAATKVKTLTQLIGTVKEAIGSGWSASFRTIIGDFDEAKNLWTEVNNVLGKMIGNSADARNELLQGWKDIGGRVVLIEGLKNVFVALGKVFKPIAQAFRNFFPAQTSIGLAKMTVAFKDFTASLIPSQGTINNIKRVFNGLFAVISIGWTIVKNIASVFGELFSIFHTNSADDGVFGFFARLGDKLLRLQRILVEGGGIAAFFDKLKVAIHAFFDGLTFDNVVERVVGVLVKVKDAIIGMFSSTEGGSAVMDIVGAAMDRLKERFGWLITVGHALGAMWDWLYGKFDTIKTAVSSFAKLIKEKVGDIPKAIKDALSDSNYSQALDTVNIGVIAALALMIKKFMNGDFAGLKGIFENINAMFTGVTDVLGAMQTKLKAEALLKIAIAVGVLVLAMMILSTIDSKALTKALIAMAVGFYQLALTMAVLDATTSNVKSAAKLGILAAGIFLLAGAMVLLAVSAKIFATMSWSELAKGLGSIVVLLLVISKVVKPLSANSAGMISAGIGIAAIAFAMNLLATAAKIFATMSWEELAKGLIGISLAIKVLASSIYLINEAGGAGPLTGIGLILIAVALNILAAAVLAFGSMDLKTLAVGIGGIAAVLLVLAGAMYIMPNGASMALQGVGLLAIGIGLVAIASAIRLLGGMSWEDMAKGLLGIGVTLHMLAAAMFVMKENISGAAAMVIAAVALRILASAVKAFSSLSWPDLIKGLLGLAVTMAILVVGMNALSGGIPVMLAFGAALLLIGGAMALFGLGANLLATAFGILATSGSRAIAVLVKLVFELIKLIPPLAVAIAKGLVAIAKEILKAAPGLIASLGLVIVALLQLIIDSIPKLVETFVALIHAGLSAIRQTFPDILATGFELLMKLLQGIRDHISEITTTVATIIVEFLTALTAKMPELVEAGIGLLVSFLEGVAQNLDALITAAADIVAKFIEGLGTVVLTVIAAGAKLIADIITGIGQAAEDIVTAGADAVISFMQGIANNIQKVVDAGFDIIIKLIKGITDSINEHAEELRLAGLGLAFAIIDGMTFGLAGKAKGIIDGFFGEDLKGSVAKDAFSFGTAIGDNIAAGTKKSLEIHSPSKVFIEIAKQVSTGFAIGMDRSNSAETSATNFGARIVTTFQQTLSAIPTALEGMKDFTPTITPVLDLTNVKSGARSLGDILGVAPIVTTASYGQARQISVDENARREDTSTTDVPVGSTTVQFVQNNTSPTALSTADIYRRTKNQLAMAKEELKVP